MYATRKHGQVAKQNSSVQSQNKTKKNGKHRVALLGIIEEGMEKYRFV